MTKLDRRDDFRPAFATLTVHAGQSPDPSTGAIMPPIRANSTCVQESPGVHEGLDHGRSHNPTRWALERCLADLEAGGAAAFAFASGWRQSPPSSNCSITGHTSPATICTAAPMVYWRRCVGAAPGSHAALSTSRIRQRLPRRSGPRVACCWSRHRPIHCCACSICGLWPSLPASMGCSRWPTTRWPARGSCKRLSCITRPRARAAGWPFAPAPRRRRKEKPGRGSPRRNRR